MKAKAFIPVDKHSSIHEWQNHIGQWAQSKGWVEGFDPSVPEHVSSKLMLIVTEVAEACECVRHGALDTRLTIMSGQEDSGLVGKPEGLPSELADVIIRVLQLSDLMGHDMACELDQKMKYNHTRSYKHGGRSI